MKSSHVPILLVMLIIIAPFAQGQNWKQYSDSAKAFIEQKNTDKAIEYYTKAREELKRDSSLTGSYVQLCTGFANLCADISKFEKAEELYLEAKETIEKVFTKEHPEYALS